MTERDHEVEERFRARYRAEAHPVFLEVERRSTGGALGATGYTTVEEADLIAAALELGPGRRLLDVGTGRGWPALHLAATTGCAVVVTDVPLEGLRIAAQRVGQLGLGTQATVVAASAAELPFRPGSFDAVVHTDVLC